MNKLKTLKDMNLPILFHNFYEEEADKVGWETNRKCRVKFDDLPETNQETMIRTCERIKNKLKAEAVKWIKHWRNLDQHCPKCDIWNEKRQDDMMHFFNLTEEDLK